MTPYLLAGLLFLLCLWIFVRSNRDPESTAQHYVAPKTQTLKGAKGIVGQYAPELLDGPMVRAINLPNKDSLTKQYFLLQQMMGKQMRAGLEPNTLLHPGPPKTATEMILRERRVERPYCPRCYALKAKSIRMFQATDRFAWKCGCGYKAPLYLIQKDLENWWGNEVKAYREATEFGQS